MSADNHLGKMYSDGPSRGYGRGVSVKLFPATDGMYHLDIIRGEDHLRETIDSFLFDELDLFVLHNVLDEWITDYSRYNKTLSSIPF